MESGVGRKMVSKAKRSGVIFIVIGLIAFFIGVVLFSSVQDGESVPVYAYIPAYGSAIFIIIGIVKFVSAVNLSRRICPECGAKYTYDDIEYHETNSYTTSTSSTASSKVNVRFLCHCPNCGKVHEYERKYTDARIDAQGNYHSTNVEEEIRKFYSKQYM